MFRMPMKHLEALLPEYVRGGLSAEERRAVQWHILACDRCRESLKLIEPVLRERRTPSAPPPEYFTGILPRVRERIARHERTRSAVRTAWTRIVAPLVSTLAVIAMVLTISPDRRARPFIRARPDAADLFADRGRIERRAGWAESAAAVLQRDRTRSDRRSRRGADRRIGSRVRGVAGRAIHDGTQRIGCGGTRAHTARRKL